MMAACHSRADCRHKEGQAVGTDETSYLSARELVA